MSSLELRPYASASTFLPSDPFVESLLSFISKWPKVFYKGDNPCFYLFDEISTAELCFEKFYCLSEILFLNFFFHLHFFDGVHFQHSQVLISILFFQAL